MVDHEQTFRRVFEVPDTAHAMPNALRAENDGFGGNSTRSSYNCAMAESRRFPTFPRSTRKPEPAQGVRRRAPKALPVH
jgi:hypothetical protein